MDALKAQLLRIQQQLSGLSASQKMLTASLVAIMVLTISTRMRSSVRLSRRWAPARPVGHAITSPGSSSRSPSAVRSVGRPLITKISSSFE